MPSKVISLRAQLIGEINDFLSDEGMSCDKTAYSLMELVVLISKYREEGVSYNPEVVICDDLTSISRLLQGREHINVGSGERTNETVKEALKKCATLAQDGWAIYLHRTNIGYNYGIIRLGSSPISISPSDILEKEPDSNRAKILYVTQISDGIVELRGSGGRSTVICFNDARANIEDPRLALNKLVDKFTFKVEPRIREQTAIYFRRVLTQALQLSHGTLVAVMDSSITERLSYCDDGTFLPNPINICEQIGDFLAEQSMESGAKLQATATLIRGMLRSDGITLFSDNGCIVGFRIFIGKADATGSRPGQTKIIGGARRRAYDTMKTKLGQGLVATFFRSQDGHMECHMGDA